MREEEFINILEKEIESIKNSPQYTKYHEIDRALFDNEELIRLNILKEELIGRIEINPDDEESLRELHSIQTLINEIPEVKEYYLLRKEIKDSLDLITKEVLMKI